MTWIRYYLRQRPPPPDGQISLVQDKAKATEESIRAIAQKLAPSDPALELITD